MNFSIHIDPDTAKRLERFTKQMGKKRNAVIGKAIKLYLDQVAHAEWPAEVRKLAGLAAGLEPFEKSRKELKNPPEDPLG